jgi:7,8-dihydropterin-6-yl-methyl-4-(beta-D-ribofuranosyl)aminobenzene 5'-phosphate synthase
LTVDSELSMYSGVKCMRLNPTGNADILKRSGGNFVRDDFAHEVNLVIRERGKTVLVTGCAHCGIVNILEHIERVAGIVPNVVIGGFHLSNPARGGSELPETVAEIAAFLKSRKTTYYTCHCTGMESYSRLKTELGARSITCPEAGQSKFKADGQKSRPAILIRRPNHESRLQRKLFELH